MDTSKKNATFPKDNSDCGLDNFSQAPDIQNLRRYFRTTRFNISDGLEEYGGDYRTFEQPAASVVAAHRSRVQQTPMADPVIEDSPHAAREPLDRPADFDADAQAAPVELVSRGRTLVVGRDASQVLECGRRLASSQTCLLLVEHSAEKALGNTVSRPNLLWAANVTILGYLGRFSVSARIGGKDVQVNSLPESPCDRFDLVLDLRPAAAANYILKPPGYYAPNGDDAELERILAELPEMIGTFQKPRFIRYQPGICAHKGSDRDACTRCRDVCPAAALQTHGERIRIDHAACLGCGICTNICPTGALRSLHVPPDEMLVAVHGRLSEERFQRASGPTVVFHPVRSDEAPGYPDTAACSQPLLCFPVAEIGCIGPEIWLSALAYGAGRVILVTPESYPPALGGILGEQIQWVSTLLAGIGQGPDRIRLEPDAQDGFRDTEPAHAGGITARFAPFQAKRPLIRQSVAHLAGQGPSLIAAVDLQEGAPFGTVLVDKNACTLCMACAGACPTAALEAAGDIPALKLRESECIQCGLCCRICPEQALGLQPRMDLDIQRVELPQVLHSEEPLACIGCGKPFASARLVERLTKRLEGHWMYTQPAEIRRLKMCRDCRIRDLFIQGDEQGAT